MANESYIISVGLTRDSLRPKLEPDYISRESPENKEAFRDKFYKQIIKDGMTEVKQEQTVVEESYSRFNDALGTLNNHNDKLRNVVRKITGESPESYEGIPVNEIAEVRELSMLEKLDGMISRVEQVNSDMNNSYSVLDKFL